MARLVTAPEEWTRRKLQIALGLGLVIVLALIAGGIWSILAALHTGDSATTHAVGPRGGSGISAQDRLAQAPLPSVGLDAAQPGDLSTGHTGTLRLPAATGQGPAYVPTGFPHTPAGALAQLIAIDQTAIDPASVTTAQQVITAWAARGGPTASTWSGVAAVTALLSAAGLPADGSSGLAVTLAPSMGFIKGSIGADFVIPCVDFIITTTVTGPSGTQTERIAAADCQRMTWQTDPSTSSRTDDGTGTDAASTPTGRWVIGAGAEPAPAPSVWPGTADSFQAGYEWLEVTR